MDESNDDIDEVALNVLVADGLDFPTAWEASQRDDGSQPAALGCIGAAILLVVAVLVIVILLS